MRAEFAARDVGRFCNPGGNDGKGNRGIRSVHEAVL